MNLQKIIVAVFINLISSFFAFGQVTLPADSAKVTTLKPTLNQDSIWENRADTHDKLLDILKAGTTTDYESAWKRARLAYYVGFFVNPETTTKSQKMEIFKLGYESAEIARKLAPKQVEGHYWYAVNYGGYGLNKGVFSSLSGAGQMRDALNEAVAIDANYYYGGPLRVRGRLYFKLPGTISFGDNQKALADLKAAVTSFAGNKLNHIYLAEVLAKVENKASALKELEIAKKLPDIVGKSEESSYKDLIATMEKSWQ